MTRVPSVHHILRATALSGVAVLCAFQLLAGCGQTVEVGFDDHRLAPGGAGAGASGGGAGGELALGGTSASPSGGEAPAAAGAPPCVVTMCRGQVYDCGNCKDDDEDGEVDALDSGCLGPCDNDELGLSTGLANAGAACRQDCYFDGDAGPGNDKCEWSHQCDKRSVAPDYPPSGEARCAYEGGTAMGVDCERLSTMQDPACLANCLPLVPNGCDCFGCCELPAGSREYHYIGAGRGTLGCQLDKLDDAKACPPCTQVASCVNDCQPCEACVGRPPEPSCQSALCGAGQKSCSAGSPCDDGDYCVTGCCVRAPVR